MKKIWKRMYQKMAVVLTASMLMTSVIPATGMAGTYDLGRIVATDSNIVTDSYKASASVGVEADDIEIIVKNGDVAVGDVTVQSTVNVATVSVASGNEWVATSSNAAKRVVEKAIADQISVVASLSNANLDIKDYLSIDVTELSSAGKMEVRVDLTDGAVASGEYFAKIILTPDVDVNWDADLLTLEEISKTVSITIVVEDEAVADKPVEETQFFEGSFLGTPYGEPLVRTLSFGEEIIEKVTWTLDGDAGDYLSVEYDPVDSTISFIPKKLTDNGPCKISLRVETDKTIYIGDVNIWIYYAGDVELEKIPKKVDLVVGKPVTYEIPKLPTTIIKKNSGIYTSYEGLSAEISEDFTTFTLTALEAFAGEEAMIELGGENGYLYYAYISVDAIVEGSELNLERTDVYLAPGETVEIPVTYQPDTAVLKTFLRENAKRYAEAAYDEDEQILRITAKEFLPEGDYIRLWVQIFDSDAETTLLAEQPIRIFILENQLEVDEDASIEDLLGAAADKLEVLMGDSTNLTPEIKMLVTEVVNGLSKFTVEQLASHGKEIKDLEDLLIQVTGWDTDTSEADGVEDIEVMGAVLNLIYNGLSSGKISITNAETPSGLSGSNMKALNIKLQNASSTKSIVNLKLPIWFKLKVDGIDLNGNVRINHMKENGKTEIIYPDIVDGYLEFEVTSFSTFVFMNYTSRSTGGGGGGGSSVRSNAIPNLSGNWIQNETGWWFQMTNGNYPANQWARINNKWYYFNAQGYMMTGWVWVSNNWYYLQPAGDMLESNWVFYNDNWYYLQADGAMAVNTTTPDGYTVNADGVWVQ